MPTGAACTSVYILPDRAGLSPTTGSPGSGYQAPPGQGRTGPSWGGFSSVLSPVGIWETRSSVCKSDVLLYALSSRASGESLVRGFLPPAVFVLVEQYLFIPFPLLWIWGGRRDLHVISLPRSAVSPLNLFFTTLGIIGLVHYQSHVYKYSRIFL